MPEGRRFPHPPEDDVEREAYSERGWAGLSMTGYPGRCNVREHGDHGYFCTRAPHEDGDHVAGGSLGIYARWNSEKIL